MLLPKDINPENSVYYIGSLVLKNLEEIKEEKIDFFDLYADVKKINNISMHLFIFSIDWLYILNLIKLDTEGNIVKCF